MSDLRKADEFWAAYEAVGRHMTVLAQQTGIARGTLNEWRRHLQDGEIWLYGQWTRPKLEEAASDFPTQLKSYLKMTKAYRTVEDIADHFNVCPREVRQAITQLEGDAVLLNVRGDSVVLERDPKPAAAPLCIDFHKHAEVEIPLGAIADNHLGSKYERLDVLEALFDRFDSYGVSDVYQAGNIIDGECRFNKFDIYCHGIEDQVANLIQKWPRRRGITTHFLTADDHEGWWVQREHIDIGRKIEQDAYAAGRDDLRHLGYMERNVDYDQPGGSSRIRVIHGGGGSTYATSYTSQKYVESIQGGEKPQIILVGHFHKFDYLYVRNVHVIQCGTTQDQTPFLRKKRIEAHVGGCVLWVKQNDIGIFTSVRVEWIPFYDKAFYAYHW